MEVLYVLLTQINRNGWTSQYQFLKTLHTSLKYLGREQSFSVKKTVSNSCLQQFCSYVGGRRLRNNEFSSQNNGMKPFERPESTSYEVKPLLC
jgi:hypothetical protein